MNGLMSKVCVAAIGEEISHELGVAMVRDFQSVHPKRVASYQIGREIIERLLSQKGCEGIRFYNALNEEGEETLVYVGVDRRSRLMGGYISVGSNGEILRGIVADRVLPVPPRGIDDFERELEWGIE